MRLLMNSKSPDWVPNEAPYETPDGSPHAMRFRTAVGVARSITGLALTTAAVQVCVCVRVCAQWCAARGQRSAA